MSACLKCGHNPEAQIAASWEFEIDREVESGNVHRFNVGGSRFGYGRNRNAWQSEFHNVRRLRAIPLALARRRVTLTRLYGKGKRAFDLDNLATGCKPVLDAMVRSGLLTGDDASRVEIHYQQEKSVRLLSSLRVLIEEFAA